MTGVSTDIGTSFVRPAGTVGDVLHAKAVLTAMGKLWLAYHNQGISLKWYENRKAACIHTRRLHKSCG